MRAAKSFTLAVSLLLLLPSVLRAGELTNEQLRLKGLRSFRVIVGVTGNAPLDADTLKEETKELLKSSLPGVLVVEKNHDAYLVVAVTIGYAEGFMQEKYGHYGTVQTTVTDWVFQGRHLNDVLSADKEKFLFLANVWKKQEIYFRLATGPEEVAANVLSVIRSQIKDFAEDYKKANPPY